MDADKVAQAIEGVQTLRDALDVIDQLLIRRRFSRDLSSVLSALRGPDVVSFGESGIKSSTTNVIRKTAFPLAFGDLGNDGIPWSHAVGEFDMTVAEGGGWHFANHIRTAAEALGLV